MSVPDEVIRQKVVQWLAYGDEDLRLARHGLTMPGGCSYRLIAYHAQQCAEKHLKAAVDEERIEVYRGTGSLPFESGEHQRIAVKIVDDRDIESLKILDQP